MKESKLKRLRRLMPLTPQRTLARALTDGTVSDLPEFKWGLGDIRLACDAGEEGGYGNFAVHYGRLRRIDKQLAKQK